jgi:hypothetical protein
MRNEQKMAKKFKDKFLIAVKLADEDFNLPPDLRRAIPEVFLFPFIPCTLSNHHIIIIIS